METAQFLSSFLEAQAPENKLLFICFSDPFFDLYNLEKTMKAFSESSGMITPFS